MDDRHWQQKTEVTQNAILRINDEKTMKLIELYEMEECLWKTNSDDYKNKEARAKAAERIAYNLGVKNFEPRHVIMKFKNLRNSYCQELKKIANSINSGVPEEEVYRPKVFWFLKMDSFLRPHLQTSTSAYVHSLVLPEPEPYVNNVKREWDENEEWTEKEDVMLPNQLCSVEQEESDHEILPDYTQNSPSVSQEPPAKKTKTEYSSSNSILSDINAKLHVLTSKREDCFDFFGKYIASLLRSLSPQKAMALQPTIVALIASAATGSGCGSGSGSGEVRVTQSDETNIS